MEFKFEANQDFQLKAIEAITGLFEGQPYIEAGLSPVIGNRLDLDDETLLKNLRDVQEINGIIPDTELLTVKQSNLPYYNFSVEMETGTGKTYVYLRTALELYREYGFRKFIVVVPSIAIREGVLKTLQITEKHFRELYRNLPYRYYEYTSKSLSQVRQFARSDSVELMVMTIDAFNKDLNVIRQTSDWFTESELPIQLVQAARPILILDEPQTKMEGEKNRRALGELRPLMTLRYSATHRNPYNRVHRLTPFDAYRQNLVKRVEVASVVQEDDFNHAFIEVRKIESVRRTMTASLNLHKLMKSGTGSEKTIKVKPGDDLFEKTDLPEYQGYIVDRIAYGAVVFAVGGAQLKLGRGESIGKDKDAIHAAQIESAIKEHFDKQRELKEQGIKALTLFFIDRVANYQNNGKLRKMFDESFNRLKETYPEWRNVQAEEVQAAYFAKKSSGEWDDSSSGAAKKDRDAYDLIMRAKERLLSFDEPVSFIFSHSALNEGWDNPNIFQICALRDVNSYIKKRQQIGRGMRLAVNQSGERVYGERTNILTVVANERYSQFAAAYQQEIESVYGKAGAAPTPVNANARKTVRRTKLFELDADFKILWDKIKRKTRYSVEIDSESVIQEAGAKLSKVEIRRPRITATTAQIELGDDDVFDAFQIARTRDMGEIERSFSLPNLARRVAYLLEFQSPPVSLSRKTILAIIRESGRLEDGIKNPHEFATSAVREIKETLAAHLVRGIQYERINEWYEMSLFEAEFQSWEDYLVPAEKSVYDHVKFDSEVERAFVEDMDWRDDIHLYVKLPAWFTVPTPVGNYNPDWAIVMDDSDDKKLYLVRETKGDGELRPTEKRKIECGEKHFEQALNINYRVVTKVSELP